MRVSTKIALLALTSHRLTDTVKEVLPVIPPPWAKSAFSLATVVGSSFLIPMSWRERVLVIGAAASAASIVHDTQVAAQMYGDYHRAAVLVRTRGVQQ